MSAEESRFGGCDDDDLVDLDDAMERMREVADLERKARGRAAVVFGRMIAKGAQRKAIAARAGVSDQTVTNIREAHAASAERGT